MNTHSADTATSIERKTRVTADETASFKAHGYVILRGVLSSDEVALLKRWVEEVERYPETPGKCMIYHEDSVAEPGRRLLHRTENFIPCHAGLARVLTGDAILGRVSQLFGEPAVLFKDKINFKLPGGRGFEPHQDMQAGWSAYASLFITAFLVVDAATIDNGCVEVAPGHHRRGLIGQEWRPLQDGELSGLDFVSCELAPGDLMFFDSFIPHRSGPNRSMRPRRALYATYNRRREGEHRIRYFSDKRKSYPPDCEREPGKGYEYKV